MTKKEKNMSNEVFSSNDFETFWVPEDGYTLIPLHSVGTMLCSQAGPESEVPQGMTYPMNGDGTHDEAMGVHLQDVDSEWFDSLDTDDRELVNNILELV
tara:strand:- start:196 stop:492 length:297 start_codon:yes stop_codon:yes gene_type:complete